MNLNGILAFLQQAVARLGSQARALRDVASAIIANRPEPARNVVVCALVLAALAFAIPKIVKIVK